MTAKQYVSDFLSDPAYTVRHLAYDPVGVAQVAAYLAEHEMKYELQRLIRLLNEYLNDQAALKEEMKALTI